MSNKSINLEPIAYRIAAIVGGGFLITLLLLSANWFFANAIAGSTDLLEVAQFSADIAPNDPQTHTTAALLLEKSFREEDQKAALKKSETAVSLSPSDYSLWQTLARLRERSGDVKGAENALRKALELAPNNSAVQWALGNVLLRQEKFQESFALIRKAVNGDPRFAGPAASIALDIFEGDISKIKPAIGNSGAAVSALALYLAKLERFDEALEIWQTLPQTQRDKVFLADSQALLTQFVSGKKFGHALDVSRALIKEEGLVPKVNTVTNGGFEYDIARDLPGSFDWLIDKGTRPSIGVSVSEKLAGSKSLARLFDGLPSKEYRTTSQTIAVTPGRSFTFYTSYKSNMEADSTLIWTISDAVSGTLLASTDPVVPLSGGWMSLNAEFLVPEDSDGIVIRLVREPCTSLDCRISGAVWFDQIGIR